MPEIIFNWRIIREWRISLHRSHCGFHPLTGAWLRGGWHFEFGPVSLFWERCD